MRHLAILLLLAAVLAAGAALFGWGYRRGAASVEVVESVRTVPVFYERPEPVRVTHTAAQVRVPVLLFAPADTLRFMPSDPELLASADTLRFMPADTEFLAAADTLRFMPADTEFLAAADPVRETAVVRVGPDSAELRVAIERQEYGGRDTTFYAVVSGPAVGGFRPRLDRLELYAAERLRTVIRTEPPRWELGPAAGAWYAPAGNTRSIASGSSRFTPAGSRSATANIRSAAASGVWVGVYARRSFGRFHLTASAGYDLRNGGAFGQVQAGVAVWRRVDESKQ